MQELLFPPKSNWKPPTRYPRFWDAKRIGVDIETRDTNLTSAGPGWARGPDGYIVGVGIAVDEGSMYFPFDHEGGGNLDKSITLRWLKDVLETPNEKVVFNGAYEMGWLREHGIDLQGTINDPSVAVTLCDENRRAGTYNLDAVCLDYLGVRKDEKLLREAAAAFGIDPKSGMWKLHSKYVGPYGEQDAALNLKLWDEMKTRLDDQDLWKAYALEMSQLRPLVDMRFRGIRVDYDNADRLLEVIDAKHKKILRWANNKWGSEIGHFPPEKSGKKLAAGADILGLKYPTIEKTRNPSLVKDWLNAQEHLYWKTVVELRSCSTTASLIRSQIFENSVDGRIHCSLHPLRGDEGGTITFRYSSSNPNLQQVPSRGVFGQLVRSVFLPEEGTQWLKADYSQQEYRLIVQYAMQMKCKGANRAGAQYRKKGADFHQIVADQLGWEREPAKTINFGIVYGMMAEGLSKRMNVTVAKAAGFLDQYHARVPFVRQTINKMEQQARADGYLRLLGGHRVHFDYWEPARHSGDEWPTPLLLDDAELEWPNQKLKRSFIRNSFNKVIQGGGAGMTKMALRDCVAAGHLPLLQVHDELDFPIEDPADAVEIQEIMSDTVHLKIPMRVDIDLAPTWGKVTFDDALKKYRDAT